VQNDSLLLKVLHYGIHCR